MFNITPEWSLFLDRDGVLNHEKEGGYICHVTELQLLPGIPEAIASLTPLFRHIIVVTNQKGIGKGLMSESHLHEIHGELLRLVSAAGGRIDRIYHCPDTDTDSLCRKPHTGMGVWAMRDFPDIDPQKSLMVGNTLSDMQFGKSLNMHTVFVESQKPMPPLPHPWIDYCCSGLPELAKTLIKPLEGRTN